jgi:pimeloyl-ACP methyl ester carboxylesterase
VTTGIDHTEMTPRPMRTLDLADGRRLAYEVVGDPEGTPVFFQHGTGDSRLCKHPDDAVTAALRVRLITADRPGVGGSSPRKRRSILDWVPDVEAIADAVGLDDFVVAGHSGGAPHALAVATKLGDRVTKVGLAAPLAPFDEPGTKGMVRDRDLRMVFKFDHVKFLAAVAGKEEAKRYLKDIKGFVAHCAEAYPSDNAVFTDPVLEPMFEAEFAEAFAQGGVGALDDMWAFLDWGFTPEDAAQHVEMFHGDADDILAPEMSDRLSRRLRDCSSHVWPGAGHYGVYAHWREFLGSLV